MSNILISPNFHTGTNIDLKDNSVWAPFVDPEFEEKGIGQELHNLMINCYFEQIKDNVVIGKAILFRTL